jgi:alkylated DNA repair protein (DNA oxidative demethylase)
MVLALVERAPFYKPLMPKSGKPFSVEETNFGTLGWISDVRGYRYQPNHPLTGAPWPPIPGVLLDLWKEVTAFTALPECCLVNLYREGAKMGAHQDADEEARDCASRFRVARLRCAVSASAGRRAKVRRKRETRRAATCSQFGGPSRMAFHGVDRIVVGSSTLVPGGGRINLTLRRVRAA